MQIKEPEEELAVKSRRGRESVCLSVCLYSRHGVSGETEAGTYIERGGHVWMRRSGEGRTSQARPGAAREATWAPRISYV